MVQATRRVWRQVANELFEREGLSTVFLHARNLLTGAAVIAAGLYATHHLENKQLVGMWTVHLAGYGVATAGTALLVLNLLDGLRRLARQSLPLALRIVATVAYVGFSLRLIQVIVYFRSPI